MSFGQRSQTGHIGHIVKTEVVFDSYDFYDLLSGRKVKVAGGYKHLIVELWKRDCFFV